VREDGGAPRTRGRSEESGSRLRLVWRSTVQPLLPWDRAQDANPEQCPRRAPRAPRFPEPPLPARARGRGRDYAGANGDGTRS
jgi:hypothetical protein